MNSAERDTFIEICRNNDVAMVGIFGSTARGEASESSDIDHLARFAKMNGEEPFKIQPLQ